MSDQLMEANHANGFHGAGETTPQASADAGPPAGMVRADTWVLGISF